MRPQKFIGRLTKIFRSLMIASAIFVSVFSVSAKSLSDYQKSVRLAKDSVDELSIVFSNEDDETIQKNGEYERELVALIRENMPPSEKVKWQGSSIETNNIWLSDKLDAFTREKSATKRLEILTNIGERLAALHEKLAELENPSVSERTKDEDKQKLAEILRREDYHKPEQQEESLLQKWWRELLEWLENVFPRPNLPDGEPTGFQSFSYVMQIVLYVLVAAVVGFLLYKFAPLLIGNYARREKREKKERVILGERIAAEDSAQNLFGEAEALAREGNLRAAIRKGYIAVLCDLSDKKIISAAQHKTNRDYLRDMRKNGELYKNMSGLTNSFERHWYGFEATDEKDWNEFRQEYERVVSS